MTKEMAKYFKTVMNKRLSQTNNCIDTVIFKQVCMYVHMYVS